jgi:glycogen debranching enzyme
MEQRPYSPSTSHPKGVRILPDETLLGVSDIAIPLPNKHLSAIQTMLELTNVRYVRDIGKNGPSDAAYTPPENTHNKFLDKFNHHFPRDGHVIAEFIFDRHPLLTEATVITSLRYMGIENNYDTPREGPLDEQEDGKVPHEILNPNHPTAIKLREKKNWGFPYYGATDTTGKNILAIHRLVAHPEYGLDFLEKTYEGRDKQHHTVLHGLERNLAWITGRMDRNPEGLLENLEKNPRHHANQTWADSPESFHHKDGKWAEYQSALGYGVAPVELQGETYDALKAGAAIYERLGRTDEAVDLRTRAEKLRSVILEKFWVEDSEHYGGYFARGTDRDQAGTLRPLEIRSSDMGHLLQSSVLDEDSSPGMNADIRFKREALIRNLFSPQMLCPSGIRTLSSDAVRYGDERYHNGGSWPWVSYYIAKGLDRHGLHGLSYDLKKRVWNTYDTTKAFFEYVSGSEDPSARITTQAVKVRNSTISSEDEYYISQPGQPLQGWIAATIYALKLEYATVTAHKLGGRYLAALGLNRLRISAAKDDQIEFEAGILQSLHPDV